MKKTLPLIVLSLTVFCFLTEGKSSRVSLLMSGFEALSLNISRHSVRPLGHLFSTTPRTTLPLNARIVEVGPRDGLQNEQESLSVEQRITFIGHLQKAGLQHIEAGAFVSPRRVPQMEGSSEIAHYLSAQNTSLSYPFLVPNMYGLGGAIRAGVKRIAIFTSSSTKFTKANTGLTLEESLDVQREVARHALAHDMTVRGYVSCVMGCPYAPNFPMNPDDVASVVEKLLEAGCDEISLGDTIGVGTPERTQTLCRTLFEKHGFDPRIFAAHFHNTNGMALSNIVVALRNDITIFDSSVGGLGGCPYAPGATGNVATEEVVAMLDALGIRTGISRQKLKIAERYVVQALGKVW